MLIVRLSPAAQRALQKHANQRDRLIAKIRAYAADPAGQSNNVKRLSGTDRPRFRLRVGDFRIIFEVEGGTMWVIDLGPRGNVYD
ncbi:MAG: type II toxin-antitoxin system RelE/ParE family toxin [Bauldia sp.]